jgi:hypothetical protein
MRDGLARIRERVSTLRVRGNSASQDRYVLLSGGAGRRRRLAEIGAAVGAVVVVLAFVGATVALRPTSSSAPQPDAPGLPAPTEAVQSPVGSTTPAGSSVPAVSPDRPARTAPSRTTPYTPPGASATATATTTTPAPTTSTTTAPPRTTAPRTTPPPSATASPAPTTPSTTTPTPTGPPPPPPPPGFLNHPFG